MRKFWNYTAIISVPIKIYWKYLLGENRFFFCHNFCTYTLHVFFFEYYRECHCWFFEFHFFDYWFLTPCTELVEGSLFWFITFLNQVSNHNIYLAMCYFRMNRLYLECFWTFANFFIDLSTAILKKTPRHTFILLNTQMLPFQIHCDGQQQLRQLLLFSSIYWGWVELWYIFVHQSRNYWTRISPIRHFATI